MSEPFKVTFIRGVPPGGKMLNKQEYDLVIATLQDNPDTWAVVYKNNSNKKAEGMALFRYLKKRGCNATTRQQEDNFYVYANWPSEVKA